MKLASKIKGIDVRNLKTNTGKSIGQVLYEEACRLKDCIQFRLDRYMATHPYRYGSTNVWYHRTGALQNSLMIDDILKIRHVGGKILAIDVFFDESGYHKSGDGIVNPWGEEWSGNGKTVNTAYLLNYGYQVKKNVWFKHIPYFGYRPAANFIEDGIDDYLSYNPYNIRVEIHKPDSYLM